MTIAARIQRLLDKKRIAYRVFPHKRAINPEKAAKLLALEPAHVLVAKLLADEQGMVLLVHSLSSNIDFNNLKLILNRDLNVLPELTANRLFNDCDAGCWPPIGQAYGLEVIIDQSIKQHNPVYFSSGAYTAMLQLRLADFLHLNSRAKFYDFAHHVDLEYRQHDEPSGPQVLEALSLPDFPNVAFKILQLSINGEHSTQELADIVSQDEFIQEQIKLYTQLSTIQNISDPAANSVQEMIEHVLGFDKVSHIALGAAAGRAVTKLKPTPDSLDFWRHAFYAAEYARRITKLVTPDLHLDPTISHLAGLFHNFGLLLFSQLFQPEYKLLRKWMRMDPKVSIAVLEKRLLGMGQAFDIVRGGHAQLGEWLLRHWSMPEAICVIAREHHSLTYKGDYSAYVKVIQLVNQLLREDGIGDGSATGVSEQLLEPLGLNLPQVLDSIKDIRAGLSGLSMTYML